MKVYTVTLSGCDDSTTFQVSVDEAGAELLATLSAASEDASRYGCMPTMRAKEGAHDRV